QEASAMDAEGIGQFKTAPVSWLCHGPPQALWLRLLNVKAHFHKASDRLPLHAVLAAAVAICRSEFAGWSGQKFASQLACHIRQAEIASLEAVRQLQVVEPEQVENRRVQVVNVDRVLGHIPANLVALADDLAALNAAAGRPDREGERMV